jgi:polysaccharide export outer membrane protein
MLNPQIQHSTPGVNFVLSHTGFGFKHSTLRFLLIMNYCFTVLFICTLLFGLEVSAQSDGEANNSSATGGFVNDNVGAVVSSNYVLKPSDVIQIEIYQEDDLEKTARIEGDGTVSLALIGKVELAGLTVSEAKSLITELYDRDYLVDPQISVLVVSFSPKVVRVLGSVNNPGVVEIPHDRDLMLTEAIAEVRGISRLGNPRALKIKRSGVDDEDSQQIEVNFSKILTDPEAEDIVLEEGDTIWVPERIL